MQSVYEAQERLKIWTEIKLDLKSRIATCTWPQQNRFLSSGSSYDFQKQISIRSK